MTSVEILAALRKRWAPPQWYMVSEVANGTGLLHRGRPTYADVVAVNAYQSGLYGGEVLGGEIKIARGDLLDELKDLEKSWSVRQFCHRWYVIVPEPWREVVHEPSELPQGWGLITVYADGRTRVLRESESNGHHATAITPQFLASMVRRASEDRADKEEQKGALLKAPMVQVMKGEYGDSQVVCKNGHVIRRSNAYSAVPKMVRCQACFEGQPPHREMIRAALGGLGEKDLEQVVREAAGRLDVLRRKREWREQEPK